MVLRCRPALAAALVAALALAGCSTSDALDSVSDTISSFNPFGTNKKPLPGQRQAVFPEGVPGVQQGVPKELIAGSPEYIAANTPPEAQPKVEEKPKPVRRASRPAPQPQRQASRPKPPRQPPAPREATAPPPAAAPSGRSAWESVPTTPSAQPTAPAQTRPAQTRPAQTQQWPSQANQPVPTIWPDPPKAQ